MKDEFIEFLKENDLTDKFKRNLFDGYGGFERYLSYIFDGGGKAYEILGLLKGRKYKLKYVIVGAFKADETPEGRDFWVNVNNMWTEKCNKLKSK